MTDDSADKEAIFMRIFGRLAIACVVVFALLQLVKPSIPAKSATAEVEAPTQVRHILNKDCYSCHSDERRLAWFDQIVPAYWLVRHDVLAARERLNFSTLGAKPPAAQKATLYEAVNMIQLGAMPLPRFLQLHPDARVTPDELATMKAYLAPWTSIPSQSASPPAGVNAKLGNTQAAVSLATIQPELDGFPFDPDFENWKPLSFTDRGDNYTFRFVLGNEIAVQAAQSGQITPWPDGSRFAKVAWQQELGPDGLIHPGKFVQVELMLKNAQQYKSTEGWGWGRWRGADLKPYGNDARFVHECTGCHAPVRGNDYVYTLPMTQAHVPGEEIVNNQAAALPANLPYQPLGWNAITMYVDPNQHTMSTLFGNQAAMQTVSAHGTASTGAPVYSPGSVLALVTWVQRDDPHWFGARIPAVPQSVEFVQVATAGQTNQYRRFDGSGMTETQATAAEAAKRMNFILDLAPAPLP
jgi:mono/diheme cytochrome c family protein